MAVGLGGVLNGNATALARPAPVEIVVVDHLDLVREARRGAVGLMTPGAGATVTRKGALAALERGRVENAVLGGVADGEPEAVIGRAGEIATIFVELPPPGRSPMRRYPVAIVGSGYHGSLRSDGTRIPGLVSIADLAPSGTALEHGRDPRVRSGEALSLRRLEQRLARAHDVRSPAVAVVAVLLAALGAFAFVARNHVVARVAVVFGLGALSASLITSGAGFERASPVLVALALLAIAFAGSGSLLPRPLVVATVLVALLVVLAIDTTINTFGPLGPRAENGGRFYGLTNMQETLLLTPVLVAAASAWLVPLAVLALVTVGWSHAGADGGGMLVFLVALAVLFLRLRGTRLTAKHALLIAAGAIVVALALVGLDAALGGSSHVTRAVGSGSVPGDIGHRLHLSYAVVTSSWHKAILFLVSVGGMVWLALHRDRGPVLEALLVGVAVSLLVNDTPVDVAGIGALGGLAVLAWERTRPSVDSRPMRRGLLALPVLAAVLMAAGCGGEGAVRALPQTVEGTIKQESPGKGIFTAQGCNGCHTYKPAGSSAQIGPDLDKLATYAKRAKQPLDEFTRTSIVKPGAYVEKGYQNVMPKTYATLPKDDVDALVEFLTKPQG